MRRAIITPFNMFAVFSFVLLAAIALLVHNSPLPRFGLAAAGAVGGFLLIGSFLVWTVMQGD
jgi:hypothetical protein